MLKDVPDAADAGAGEVRRPRLEGDPGELRRSPRQLIRLFTRHRRGVVAVEFAMLAAPLLALLCVVAETGFVTLAQQTLDIALDRGVRALRTGNFQDAADGTDPNQRFRRVLCGGQAILFSCANVRLDVSSAASFSDAQPSEPFDRKKKTWAVGFGTRFDCSQGGDTIAVRVAVPVRRLFAFLDFTGRTMSDSTQLLIATEVFKAEAYGSKSC